MRKVLKRRFYDSTSATTWRIVAILFASLALFAFKTQAQEPLRLGTVYHPPLMGTDESVLNKMAKAAFAAENIKVQFDNYPMARIKWALDEQKSHAVIGSINWFTERKQSSNFISVKLYQALSSDVTLVLSKRSLSQWNQLHAAKRSQKVSCRLCLRRCVGSKTQTSWHRGPPD